MTFLYIARVCRWQTVWSTILHWLFQACLLCWNCTIFGRVWWYAGNDSAVNATMNNKNQSKKKEIELTQYHSLYLHFDCFLLTSKTILWMLCAPPGGAQPLSLNAVSDIYCYQHHQVTVWLWAIFPLWMWKRCKGRTCQHPRKCDCFMKFFCSKWPPPPLLLKAACVRERVETSGIVASASHAKSHLLVKLCQCCHPCDSFPPFPPGGPISLISHRQDQPQPSSSAMVAECSFDTM